VKAEPVTVEGSTVVIGFDNDFARAYWQDRYRGELEQGLSDRLSLTVRVRCVVQTLPADSPSPAEDPMLRAALETFRRPERIMEIE
jgi:chromosomal replication initiation ATPase DnaA